MVGGATCGFKIPTSGLRRWHFPATLRGPDLRHLYIFPMRRCERPLRATVERHLGKPAGARITRRELEALVELRGWSADIVDLTGLGFARRLTELDLSRNDIADITPLIGLANLSRLNLRYNRVDDITPLVGLGAIRSLLLFDNQIVDLAPLGALNKLFVLGVGANGWTDLSELPHLPGLETLFIEDIGFADINPLRNFSGLTRLSLRGNPVKDFTPLADLKSLRRLGVTDTGISDLRSVVQAAPALTELTAGSNSISDLSGVERLVDLVYLYIGHNAIEDLAPIEQLKSLRGLDAWDNRVRDLSPLTGLTGLEWLRMDRNQIRSIDALGTMTHLEWLTLAHNSVVDISPLANLTTLARLNLSTNQIVDVSPLADLTQLRELNLAFNRIVDLAPLAHLSQLQSLQLDGNRIARIDPVETLTDLAELRLADNQVVDLTPLAGLTGLVTLDLARNDIVDIAPLAGLVELRELDLAYNRIEDLSGLAANVGLDVGDSVDVRGNPLDDDADAIALLEARGVEVQSGGARIVSVHEDTVVVMEVNEPIVSTTAFGGRGFDAYANVFFTHFQDEFDYLLFFSNLDSIREHERAPYVGIYLGVMNDTEGLGINTFYSNRYGSAGRLRGVIHFPYNRALQNGPALHELQHAWSNHAVDTGWSGHWGFSSANGQLGGFDLRNLNELGNDRYSAGSFGTFANGGNRPAYSPIELYYAGYVSAEEVPDLQVAEDAAWMEEEGELSRDSEGNPIFTASGLTTYAIEDLVAMHGARVPSVANAQWHHRAALILLVDDDHPATEQQLATLVDHAAYMSLQGDHDDGLHNFYEATGGRGSISFDLDGLAKVQALAPAGLPESFGTIPAPRFTSIDGQCRTAPRR